MKEYDFEQTPIVDIVNDIIVDATDKGASDIHFDPHENFLNVRIRIDGDLINYTTVDSKYQKNLITRIKLLAGMNITEQRLPQDGTIKGTIRGKDLDLRVSAMPTNYGEKIVIRILDYSMSLEGLESLYFTKENYDKLTKMLSFPNGIILITGATGSGKSTTVYSMLQKLNNEETNIITVEDPIEMNIEGLNQVQVNSEIGLDFSTILRSILRQDPNVILIGEIRDSETAKIAVRASITGHLVLSTLHTNNSITTIERLVDMDVEKYLLSSALKGIISQTLAKKLCSCKIKRATTEAEKKIIKKALGIELDEVYDANEKGCDKCKNGYRGRIALQEVLLINDEIANAINNDTDREKLKCLIYSKDHAKTILQDGLLKVLNGLTTISEVFRLVDVESDAINIYGNNTQANNITDNYINMPIVEKNENDNVNDTNKETIATSVINNINQIMQNNQNINQINENKQNNEVIDNNQDTIKEPISNDEPTKEKNTIASSVLDNIDQMIQNNQNNEAIANNQEIANETLINDTPLNDKIAMSNSESSKNNLKEKSTITNSMLNNVEKIIQNDQSSIQNTNEEINKNEKDEIKEESIINKDVSKENRNELNSKSDNINAILQNIQNNLKQSEKYNEEKDITVNHPTSKPYDETDDLLNKITNDVDDINEKINSNNNSNRFDNLFKHNINEKNNIYNNEPPQNSKNDYDEFADVFNTNEQNNVNNINNNASFENELNNLINQVPINNTQNNNITTKSNETNDLINMIDKTILEKDTNS